MGGLLARRLPRYAPRHRAWRTSARAAPGRPLQYRREHLDPASDADDAPIAQHDPHDRALGPPLRGDDLNPHEPPLSACRDPPRRRGLAPQPVRSTRTERRGTHPCDGRTRRRSSRYAPTLGAELPSHCRESRLLHDRDSYRSGPQSDALGGCEVQEQSAHAACCRRSSMKGNIQGETEKFSGSRRGD